MTQSQNQNDKKALPTEQDIIMPHEPFRKHQVVNRVAHYMRALSDNLYNYKLVIYDYPKNPNNFDDHEKRGYEVVYTTEVVTDDRSFSPDNNPQEKLRPTAITKRTADGYNQVLMRILKTRELQNKKDDFKADQLKYIRSSKSSLRKTKNQVVITGEEVNTSNAQTYNPTNNNSEGN